MMIRMIIASVYNKFKNYVEKGNYDILRNKYEIAADFRFNGRFINFYGPGNILVSPNSYIGGYSTIQAARGKNVIIGEGCRISHGVRIYTKSSMPDTDFSKKELQSFKTGDVIIGNYCWIGANVFINPGITIGANSVIGSNSVVTKNIPPNTIYGGVPARLIREKKKLEKD